VAQANGTPLLRVLDAEGSTLLEIDLEADPVFVMHWNHSVTGILVSDHYRIEGGALLLHQSHTPAFDAGLGHIPGRGVLESDGAGGYWIRDIDEPLADNAFWLRVGAPAVDHRIEHAGHIHSLSAIAAGQRVRIEVSFR
jgi:hypothetical protein